MVAYARSGCAEKIAAERVGGQQAGIALAIGADGETLTAVLRGPGGVGAAAPALVSVRSPRVNLMFAGACWPLSSLNECAVCGIAES
jgi:hypothetical protein